MYSMHDYDVKSHSNFTCFATCKFINDIVTDRARPVRLPQFARLRPTEPIRGRYQSGRRWHIPVAPQRRPLPTRGPARSGACIGGGDHHFGETSPLLFLTTLLHLMTPPYVLRWNSLSDYCL